MPRSLYDLLILLLTPLAFTGLWWRARRQTGAGAGLGLRLGRVPVRSDRPLWLHAASVGEVQALAPLLRALRSQAPDLPLLVTTFTAAGAARARALDPALAVLPLPWDLRPCVGAFLARVAPRALLVMEAELWPNLLHGCVASGVPFAFVSARLSERSLARAARVGSLLREPLGAVHTVLAQSRADGARWAALGVPESRIRVAGNIKWDIALAPAVEADASGLRASLFGRRPVLVAGSTREGEEPLVLDALAMLRTAHPDLALVLAPRHPERATAVEALCRARDLAVVRRSAAAPLGDGDVLLVDGLGELANFYALADVVFVGGSLTRHGGHNLLEPAALARAVLTGPHHDTAPEVLASLRAREAVVVVADAQGLARAAGRLLDDVVQRRALGDRARAAVLENRGALQAALALVAGLVSAA